ncbi:hypothetical protein B0T16DRAFT_82847 [Cercophora newfieldiana]|uniref:Uncharacterized protein n=1 Tax=Cercophora newfieldiana TaxID=92897 RepID=A0AA39YFT8_9PEZI|nr:hypothetical protein B0T16DRAFT_82847 [Cercophora newfieldiana]
MDASELGGTIAGTVIIISVGISVIVVLCRRRHIREQSPVFPDEEQGKPSKPPSTGAVTPKSQDLQTLQESLLALPEPIRTAKSLVPPRQARVTRLGAYLNPGGYLNPAGEPWVKVPPPKIPLPARPNTPASPRSPSSSQLNLRSPSSSQLNLRCPSAQPNLRSPSTSQLCPPSKQQHIPRAAVSPGPTRALTPASNRNPCHTSNTNKPTS